MEKEKYVDESWKDRATKEKEFLSQVSESETQAGNIHVSESAKRKEEEDDKQEPAQESPIGEEESIVPEPQASRDEQDGSAEQYQINFVNYVTSLGFQAMIFLGEMPNPATNQTEKNLDQAKFLIDTLTMLKEKTKGNLDENEEKLLNSTVYELQMKFVDISQKENPSDG